MNRAQLLLSRLLGFQDEAGDEDKSGSGDGGDKGGDQDKGKNNNIQTIDIDYDKLALAIKKNNDNDNDNSNGDSIFKTLKAGEDKETTEKQKIEEITKNVEFDRSFNSFIESNKNLFSLTCDKIREGAINMQGRELTEALARTAAKDFFSNDKNLSLLTDEDQAYLKKEVLSLPDKFVDADRAWDLLQNAVHISRYVDKHSDFTSSGGDDSTKAPNVDAYIEKVQRLGAGLKEEQIKTA